MMIFHELSLKHKLPSADGLEFEGLVDALEAHGLVKIVPSKSKIKQDDQVTNVFIIRKGKCRTYCFSSSDSRQSRRKCLDRCFTRSNIARHGFA